MKDINNYSVMGIHSDYESGVRIFHVFQESPFKQLGWVKLICESKDENEIGQQLIAEVCGVGFIKD